MIAVPSGAFALCTPEYVQLTGDAASKVLVGCCNADGTWKSGTSTKRECLRPSNMCQQGHCDGTVGSSCNASSTGVYNNAAGDCVLNSSPFCKLGTCQQQLCTLDSDPSLVPGRCDDATQYDAKQCTADSCVAPTSYIQPTCLNAPLNGGENCDLNPAQTCKKGGCSAGLCAAVANPGAFCGTVAGNVCTPKHCDGNSACTADPGGSITCVGDLKVCKKWECVFNGTTPVCSQVKVNPLVAPENDCDTNHHDCKLQTCRTNGACGAAAQPATTSCDTNFTTPLTDCRSGQCDARKNCENEDTDGYPGYYDNNACQPDADACSTETCQGLTCTAACDSNLACSGCGGPGHCSGTVAPCSCVQ
jgi:hypothetical protein